ncbi:N-6 DNA methylase [Pseudomonas sp. PA-3-5D]|nr:MULTISPECIES: N-6 DNA methylase [unclassified Pseudomonas]MCF5511185.1 N-6 DNA methylase [Pseudomonas sp. PA-3-6H]MCF5565035.1 N-6 DNA methylase [Pseudomonas sp. PA-3-5D]
MKEKENQQLLVKFKSDLLKVGSKIVGSEQKRSEESYKLFIEYSFNMLYRSWKMFNIDPDESKDNGSASIMRTNALASFRKVKCLDELGQAFISYCELVQHCEPFTDVLTMLHEEFLLSGRKGDGLGAFYTPADIANLKAELMFTDAVATEKFGDDCCGAGSLTLGVLKRAYKQSNDLLSSWTLELADIDELACKAAFVQIVATMVTHQIPIHKVKIFNYNILTDWRKEENLLVMLRSPDLVPNSSIKAGNVQAFDNVSALCKTSSKRTKEAVAS